MQTFDEFIEQSSGIIDDAVRYNLTYEFIYSALVAMRDHKSYSPSDAIKSASNEWID